MASFMKRLELRLTRSGGTGSSSDPVHEPEKDGATTTATQIRTQDELEANDQLRKIKRKHRWDPNLPTELAEEIDDATTRRDAKEEIGVVEEIVEDSPYPEVRSVTRNVSNTSSFLTIITRFVPLNTNTIVVG